MFTKWTSHLSDPEEQLRFKNQIVSAKPVLDRLAQLISEDEQNLDKVELHVKQFEVPNWDYRQAFYNGSRSSLNSLKKLIDLDQQDISNDRKLTFYPDRNSTKG